MKKILFFLIFALGLISGCKQTENPLVATAFHQKLYLSEVLANIPYSVSKEDSLLYMEQYVDEWLLRQTLLAQAKRTLTANEQDFFSQIEKYKERLLIQTYLQKIESDSALFEISKQELADFLNLSKADDAPEYKDMVKLNYIKLSNPSKLYKLIKELFFEEIDRVKAIKQLETLCADTIEYYLDSDHWFYADYIENELPFTLANVEKNAKNKLDIVQEGSRYLIIILDKKSQLQPKNTLEDRKIAQLLLQQQKRAEFVSNFQDSILQKALLEKQAIRFGFSNY